MSPSLAMSLMALPAAATDAATATATATVTGSHNHVLHSTPPCTTHSTHVRIAVAALAPQEKEAGEPADQGRRRGDLDVPGKGRGEGLERV